MNSRNGYRHRDLDTRVGTLDVAVPKQRTGSLYPEWLLERSKRAERALTSVVTTCHLLGVSTRRMDKLVQTLGITGLSKSQVSVMAKELDEHVEQFRTRRLEDACRRQASACVATGRPMAAPSARNHRCRLRAPVPTG